MRFKVEFRIETNATADKEKLTTDDIQNAVAMAFDTNLGANAITNDCETSVTDIKVEKLGRLRMGLNIEDGDES